MPVSRTIALLQEIIDELQRASTPEDQTYISVRNLQDSFKLTRGELYTRARSSLYRAVASSGKLAPPLIHALSGMRVTSSQVDYVTGHAGYQH